MDSGFVGGLSFVMILDGIVFKDVNLGDLALTHGRNNAIRLNPGFTSGRTNYTASVDFPVNEVTVTPTTTDSTTDTVIKLNGVTDTDGTVTLAEGSNTITVEVTTEDIIDAETYTVVVPRRSSNLPVKNTHLTNSDTLGVGLAQTAHAASASPPERTATVTN